jgi:putative intracellular protease/amidase
MNIAIPLFDGITALDAIGPYEVLSRLPKARVRFIGVEAGPYKTDNRQLTLIADEPLSAVPHPEIHATSEWTTSVCTGSLLLAAAGVLRGLQATTHWASMDRLSAFGAVPSSRRIVEQGKVITAAGVSSGIDMGLHLAARIAGPDIAQAIQLGIEYDQGAAPRARAGPRTHARAPRSRALSVGGQVNRSVRPRGGPQCSVRVQRDGSPCWRSDW